MKLAAWLPFGVLALAAVGCDPLGADASRTQTAGVPGSTFDPAAPGNRVEPARFGKPGPAPADADAVAAKPAVVSASLAAAPVSAAFDSLEAVSGGASRVFDGAAAASKTDVVPVSYRASAGFRRPSPIVRTAKMAIDTDGEIASRDAFEAVARRDKWRRDQTSLRYADGRSLDPTRVPFIVIPNGFQGAQLGDLAYVQYHGRGAWAIVGDYGPRGHFGEASSALAAKLGINPDGRVGGVESGVTYTIYPGTGRGPARNETELASFLSAGGTQLAASSPQLVSL